MDSYREKLRDVYSEIPLKGIYYNSRSSMDFSYIRPDKKLCQVYLDPMVSSVIVSAVVPKSCVLYRGGHGGGKTSMIEEVSTSLFDIPKDEIVSAMIRGNDDQNVNTLLAAFKIGKLLKGEEEVKWRKFVTCPIKIADEINRFPPTAQNALFEIFNKGRVEFVDNVYEVNDFELFATENPRDVGTYPMSRPFLDRFGICIPAPQLPSAEDLMALSARKDDKIYKFDAPKRTTSLDDAKEMEKIVNDSVKISNDGLLYMIYLAQSLETCTRGDFGDKTHCEISLEERCKGCGYSTDASLCRFTEGGFSGRAFLDLQRWSKGYSYFLNAFENPKDPKVQMSVIETLVPYSLYHRVDPNDALFTKDPYFGRKLYYLKEIAKKARESFATIKEPLAEIPAILKGDMDPDKAKIKNVKKDLVVVEHFAPIVEASKLPEFRTMYNAIENSDRMAEDELVELEKHLVFETELPPRAKAFLRSKAKVKSEGGQTL